MSSMDETVTYEEIQEMWTRIRAEGWQSVFERLEQEEPALAGFCFATLTTLGRNLSMLNLPKRASLVIEREMMAAQMVCILAMRQGCRRLWSDFLPGLEEKP